MSLNYSTAKVFAVKLLVNDLSRRMRQRDPRRVRRLEELFGCVLSIDADDLDTQHLLSFLESWAGMLFETKVYAHAYLVAGVHGAIKAIEERPSFSL